MTFANSKGLWKHHPVRMMIFPNGELQISVYPLLAVARCWIRNSIESNDKGITGRVFGSLDCREDIFGSVPAEDAPNAVLVKAEQNFTGSGFTQLLQGPEPSVTVFSSVLSPHCPPGSWKVCREERPKTLFCLSWSASLESEGRTHLPFWQLLVTHALTACQNTKQPKDTLGLSKTMQNCCS